MAKVASVVGISLMENYFQEKTNDLEKIMMLLGFDQLIKVKIICRWWRSKWQPSNFANSGCHDLKVPHSHSTSP